MVAAAIGIDLGSNKAVMGVVKRKGIDIVLNEGSNRQTPVVIAYQMQERLIGDPVKIQLKKNFKNSVIFPTRFLGLNAQCSAQLELEKRYVTHKVVTLENNKIAFEVTQSGNMHTFSAEQCVGFYLKKLHEFYVKDGVTTKDIVLTVPSYASNTERQALVDAADIAGLKCLRVINESTAICYNYGFFRKGDLSKEEERIVAFVDMGHSKTTVTIAGFKQQECRIICHKSDRNLGGRDLDYQVAQKLGGEFLAKFGDDPREGPRTRLRLYETIEKARKLLSGDTEASINIDYLMNEEDLNRKLKREEFEQLIDPQVRQLADLLRESIAISGLDVDKIHFVELIGDCTRTPVVQAIIKQIFEKEDLQRTLNASETIARGASLNSAMMTPHFNVQAFTMNDYNSLPVTVNYCFKDLETGEAKEPKEYRDFFQLGQKFPLVQQLKFDNKEGSLTLRVDYSESASLMTGLPNTIAQYEIARGKRAHAENPLATTKLCIRVKNNVNQIPELEKVEMTENWTEEEQIPVKVSAPVPTPPKPEENKATADGEKPAEEEKKAEEPVVPQEQKFELKIRKKERTTDVSFKTVSHAIPPDMKVQFRDLEIQLYSEDRKILDLKEAKYILESFTYEMKEGIDQYGKYEAYIEPSLKAAYMQNLTDTVAWIYADGEEAPLEEQQSRLQALQAVGNPLKKMQKLRSDFPDNFTIYTKFQKHAQSSAQNIDHLTSAQKNQITSKCDIMYAYLMQLEQEMEQKPKHVALSQTLEEIQKKQAALEAECNAILATPAPKKEEVKTEAPADDCKKGCCGDAPEGEPAAADSEMKDEAEAPKAEAEGQ